MPDDIKTEMEEKKTLDVIKQFDASLTKMQNTQLEITNFLKKHQDEEKEFELQVTSSISELTNKLNSFKISNTSGSGDNLSSHTTNNPASTHGHTPSHRFGEAMKTVSNPNFLYNGNPKQWQLHKKKLLNIIWALSLSRLEAIKIIRLSLNG